MTLGEVLKDLYRLALLPDGDRVFVYLESDRLHRYMAGATVRYGFDLDRDDVVLEPSGAAVLPASAAQIVGPALLASRVTASRLTTIPVGQGLRLSVYVVEPASSATNQSLGPAPASTSFRQAQEQRSPLSSGSQVSGARGEIHAAVQAVLRRSGRDWFGVDEVVRKLRSRGSRYAESTIRTMVHQPFVQ